MIILFVFGAVFAQWMQVFTTLQHFAFYNLDKKYYYVKRKKNRVGIDEVDQVEEKE